MKTSTPLFAGVLVASAFLVTNVPLPAMAAEVETAAQSVGVSDLVLDRLDDQASLRRRIEDVSAEVCRRLADREVPDADADAECRDQAFKGAWKQARVLIAAARSRALLSANAGARWADARAVIARSTDEPVPPSDHR